MLEHHPKIVAAILDKIVRKHSVSETMSDLLMIERLGTRTFAELTPRTRLHLLTNAICRYRK